MRGDSIRDLYAKTLALVGLGVLAGAGALVDYWPIGVTTPEAASALRLPLRADALAVPSSGLASMPASGLRPRMVRLSLYTSSEAGRPIGLASLPVATATRSAGAAVDLSAPTARVTVFASAELDDSAMQAFPDAAALPDEDSGSMWGRPPAVAMSEESAPEGFIAGAFRKTGSSIVSAGSSIGSTLVDAGVKTGSSIVDAMRVVGGAVRKALPN